MFIQKIESNLLGILFFTFFVNTVLASDEVFPGSGNELDGVNELMVYVGIDSSNLVYNLGKKRIFLIRYGEKIDRSTFSALINGVDISKRFHPVPNTEEKVYLRLKKGMNDLNITISDFGNQATNGAIKTDQDDFVVELKGPVINAMHMTSPPPGIEKIELPPQAATNSNRPIFIDRSKR